MSRTRLPWILVALLAAVAALRILPAEEASPTDGGAARAVSQPSRDRITAERVPVVASALARSAVPESFERERNLFEYAQSPEELAAIEAKARAAADATPVVRPVVAPVRPAPPPAAPAPPAEPAPPPFPYQYVGTIGPLGDPFAVLSGPDRLYRYFKAGEIIDERFRLEYIGEDRLDLTYVDPRFADRFSQVARRKELT